MTTELIANSPTPGTQAAIATLAAAITSPSATSLTSSAAAPSALQTSGGQFRIVVDSEIMIVTAGQAGTSWTVTRGAEGSTAATHVEGADIFHDLTAAGLQALIDQSAVSITSPDGTLTVGGTVTDPTLDVVYGTASNTAAEGNDSRITGALQKSGGTMSGALAMGSSKITGLANGSASSDAAAFGQIPTAGSSTPEMDGTGSAGSASTWSKSDHVHPTDTSRAPLDSPALTGSPTAPTASANDDSTKLATTAYVDGSYTPTTERVNSVSSSGSAQAIPMPQTDTINRIVLSANCTLTFPTAAAGKSFMLQVVQPSSGGPYSVTWPGSDLAWVAGSAPTQATAASKRDLYSFVCIDGTNWEGIQVSPSGGY